MTSAATYKVPRHLVIVGDVPRSPAAKADHRAAKALADTVRVDNFQVPRLGWSRFAGLQADDVPGRGSDARQLSAGVWSRLSR